MLSRGVKGARECEEMLGPPHLYHTFETLASACVAKLRAIELVRLLSLCVACPVEDEDEQADGQPPGVGADSGVSRV
eukprot:364058-Chlamydomonas_euryale.AAC.2